MTQPTRKTFLPQNKFYSTAISPPAVESDGIGAKPILASSPSEAAIGLTRDHPVAADNFETDMERLLGVAGKRPRRRLKLPRFVPDYEAMQSAMDDPGAPRALEGDPVWADPAPLFLQGSR